MIYERPVIRAVGDYIVSVEFSDQVNMSVCFRALATAEAVRARRLPGVYDVQPTTRSIGLFYDRAETTFDRLREEIAPVIEEAAAARSLRSRLVQVPVWYDDPWSVEVAAQNGLSSNIEFVAELNGLTVTEVIDRHSGAEHLITLTAAPPGNHAAYPLTDIALFAPKYDQPRTFTPARAVAMAGRATCIYPTDSPGGYQLLGRAAVDTYDPGNRSGIAPADGVLFAAGDRLRYRSVGPLEYEEIWNKVREGAYDYQVQEEVIDIDDYLATLESGQSGASGEA